jgi:hypothetical protein
MPAYTNATQPIPELFRVIVAHHHKMDSRN